MEELDMSLVEILIRKEEIKWMTRALVQLWQTDLVVQDIIRNEDNELEIRLEKVIFEQEKESD
jgi:hypothetical protein